MATKKRPSIDDDEIPATLPEGAGPKCRLCGKARVAIAELAERLWCPDPKCGGAP